MHRAICPALKNARKVVFHFGMNYDLWAINKLYPGTLRWEQIIDTVVVSRMINSKATRHSLKDIGEALGLPCWLTFLALRP